MNVSAPTPAIFTRAVIIPALLLALLGFGLYANTLDHGYVMDDYSVIQDNWVTRGGLSSVGTIFTTPYRYGYRESGGSSYRPLTLLSFALEWQAAPDDPRPAHTANALLYAALCALAFVVLVQLTASWGLVPAFMGALWFAAHPLHTEVVANIKGREDVFALAFGLLAFSLLLRHMGSASRRTLALSVIAYFLALLSKETAVTFLLVFPAVLLVATRATVVRALKLTGFYLLPLAAYFALRAHALSNSQNLDGQVPALDNFLVTAPDLATRLATAFAFIPKYASLLLYPYPLVSDYSYAQYTLTSWDNPMAWLGVVLVIGVLAGAFLGLRKRHPAGFALLLLAATLGLTSNIVFLIGSNFAERFLFAPSLGFALLMAWGFARLARASFTAKTWKELKSRDWVVIVSALAITAALGTATVVRNRDWHSEWTLYVRDVQIHPESARLQYHFGLKLSDESVGLDNSLQDRRSAADAAVSRFYRALSLYPEFPEAYVGLAVAEMRRNEYFKARDALELALDLNPRLAEAHSNYAVCLSYLQQVPAAAAAAEEAVRLNPHYLDAWRNLGAIKFSLEDFAGSAEAYARALALDPLDVSLGRALADAERQRDAQ